MIKKTGINGILQASVYNRNAETERLAATVDYVTMMTDIDIPAEEDEDEEQEI